MTFDEYYQKQFPNLLREYVEYANSFRVSTDRCPHQSAGNRACVCLIVPAHNLAMFRDRLAPARVVHRSKIAPESAAFDDPRFWRAWYFMTLTDQCIHAHFRPVYRAWEHATGRTPLPMFPAGFGCWHVARPNTLLQGTPFDEEWRDACAVFVTAINTELQERAQIDPSEFFAALRRDPSFGGEHEDILSGIMPG